MGMPGHIDLFFPTDSHPLKFLSKFLTKMCPNLYLPGKLAKICRILTVWPYFFLVFSLNEPLFQRKFSHRKTHIFKMLSENPSHFQSRVPPPTPPGCSSHKMATKCNWCFQNPNMGNGEILRFTWMASYLFSTKFLGWGNEAIIERKKSVALPEVGAGADTPKRGPLPTSCPSQMRRVQV